MKSVDSLDSWISEDSWDSVAFEILKLFNIIVILENSWGSLDPNDSIYSSDFGDSWDSGNSVHSGNPCVFGNAWDSGDLGNPGDSLFI